MSGIFTEQGFVDRLVIRVENRFRFFPAWRKWLEKRGGVWCDRLASERLQKEYLDSVPVEEKPTGRAGWAAVNARSANSQAYAMGLLSRDPRLIGEPEELETERPILPPFPRTEQTLPLSNLAGALSDEEGRAELEDWTLRVRVRVESHPNCLLRTDPDSPDLGSLHPLFVELFGPYVTRVPPQTWTRFPESLTPEVAWYLTGRHVCFLEGPENDSVWKHRFAQVALKRWLTWGQADWTGKDGVRYTLQLPRFYLVTGPSYVHSLLDGVSDELIEVRKKARRSDEVKNAGWMDR